MASQIATYGLPMMLRENLLYVPPLQVVESTNTNILRKSWNGFIYRLYVVRATSEAHTEHL
jgi:hypothetical protein